MFLTWPQDLLVSQVWRQPVVALGVRERSSSRFAPQAGGGLAAVISLAVLAGRDSWIRAQGSSNSSKSAVREKASLPQPGGATHLQTSRERFPCFQPAMVPPSGAEGSDSRPPASRCRKLLAPSSEREV